MNSTSKNKISEIFADLLRERLQQTWLGDWHYREIIDLLKSMGMEVVKRGREKQEEWDLLSYARLLPPPKDDKKSVCVKIWQDKENIDPQVWVRLDRDLAMKMLVFGKIPETK
jgi:hypothetical protein